MNIRRESAKRVPFRVERSEERVRRTNSTSSNDERVRPGMVRDWCSQQNVHE